MMHPWPWMVVVGAGALHGLNPCTGWALATTCGLRSHDKRQALRALLPLAAGHAASIASLAAWFSLGLSMPKPVLALICGLLLFVPAWLGLPPRHAGLALSAFLAATIHGTGMMLVPALVPLCLGDSPAREITASGSLTLALAAVAVHMMSMLIVTAAVTLAACGGIDAARRKLARASSVPHCVPRAPLGR